MAHVESLESRRLFAVATASWFAPYLEAGTNWTLRTTTSGGSTGTFSYVNTGSTLYNGVPCVGVNVTSTNGITGKAYYGADAGHFVTYAEETAFGGNSETDVYTPYLVSLPANLSAGVPVVFITSNLNTETRTSGTEIVTYTETYQYTLVSESPTSVTVPAGAYSAYQVTRVDSRVGSDGSSTDPDTTNIWYAPDVGVVKSVDQDTGLLNELITFQGKIRRLGVIQQPTATTFGEVIKPAARVALQDGAGVTVGASDEAVTITASLSETSTGQGVLGGATVVATSGGVANFNDLSIDKPGRYVLKFTDSKGRIVGSEPFDVSAGKLQFSRIPSEGVAGGIVRPGIKVELVDGNGKRIKDAPSLVTLTITGAGIGLPIEGNTAQLVNGVAEFDALKLTKAFKYTLVATDAQGSVAATSPELDIKGPKLDFKIQPRKAGVNGRIKYGITLEDPRGKRIFNSVDTVRLSLNVIDGPPNAELVGSTDILTRGAAINDTQPYIVVNAPGTYSLTATLGQGIGSTTDVESVEPVTSNPFEVVRNRLYFTKKVANTQINTPLAYEITLKDYRKNVVASFDQLSVSLVVVSDGFGAALTGTNDTLKEGVAKNNGAVPIAINAVGSYRIAVKVVPAIPDDPIPEELTSKIFKIKSQILGK